MADLFSVHTRYIGKQVMSDDDTNRYIAGALGNSSGFMVARLGAVELNYIYNYLKDKNGMRDERQMNEALRMLCFNAGFFPREEKAAERLAKMYLDAVEVMDLCGVWNVFMEDYILKKYAPECKFTKLAFLEPWNTRTGNPWSKALMGKKVVVVHPFTDTMEKQYLSRDKLFTNSFDKNAILPQMNLRFVKAVQSIGGQGTPGFNSWFDAYDHMLNEILKEDFDVAILGCGAYGFPLAADIKRSGRKAIHIGGATQLWFGIKGKRWESNPDISRLFNEYWVSPSENEKPEHAEGVEDGCYW
ncbi:hypothetical protein [Butyrivibrio sp. YAB3001]|uniref:hypothetical protein n=1 Tax=Butyrivibrio sp. YAB3001 TaxID=1520812 RepID=UPI001A9A6138|nr:hypothetical protein [Butyrivibrio sp. YAB3001]